MKESETFHRGHAAVSLLLIKGNSKGYLTLLNDLEAHEAIKRTTYPRLIQQDIHYCMHTEHTH